MTADRLLLLLLRLNAGFLLLAAPCVLLPFSWMDMVHREWLNLGPLTDAPITRYMARSLALLYALHGSIVLIITLNWPRYRSIVPYLAWLHIVFGFAMVLIDLEAGMPISWTVGEGSAVGFGIVLLLLYKRASRVESGV